jgi:uncharacterized protein with PIN domain
MPVSGLVVSVADDESARRVAERIARDGSFTLGGRVGLRLSVALDAADGPTAERRHEWLRQLPGVVKVDVAFVYTGAEGVCDVG